MRHLRLELLILNGADAGRSLELGAAATVLGRSAEVALSFPHDGFLSGSHVQFAPAPGGTGLRITDLRSTNGTFLNGARIDEVTAVPGDIVQAGSLLLRLVASPLPPDEEVSVLSLQDARPPSLLEHLTSRSAPLFCLVDAAADPTLPELLGTERGGMLQSLYEGPGAQDLAAWAPYLLAVSSGSALLATLLEKGWGKGWMTFCSAHLSFADLRRHLRHFLMVKLEDGPQVYFRFYDPRVLRDYLPTATYPELLHFFGPVQEWLMEGAAPGTLLRSRCSTEGLSTEAIPVVP